ncbi:MAG: hypothetical protein WCK42_00620 [Myxococcaceae bacterium]
MKLISIFFISLFVLSGCGGSEGSKQGQPFNLGEPYMRATDNEYQMSVKSFLPANGSGPKVTLVGMIHVGESSYYNQVQGLIDQANSVLWEAIGGDPQGDSYATMGSILPSCQTLFQMINHQDTADQLGLVHQQLTYPQGKAVWADLNTEPLLDQFLKTPFAESKRNEMPNTWNTPKCYQVLWLFKEGLKLNPNPELGRIDFLPGSGNATYTPPASKKTLTRRDLAKIDPKEIEIFPGFDEVLLERRNDVVLEKLAQVLAYSQGEILIVYGAAHMADIEKRFTKQHNYVPHQEHRLVAFTF